MKSISRKSSPPPPVKCIVTPVDASVTEKYVEGHRRTRKFAPGEFAAFERCETMRAMPLRALTVICLASTLSLGCRAPAAPARDVSRATT